MKNRSNNFDNSGYVCNYALILKTKNKIKNALFTIFANVNFTRDPPHCLPTAQLEEAPGRPHAAQQGPHTAPHHSSLTSGPRLLGPPPRWRAGPRLARPWFHCRVRRDRFRQRDESGVPLPPWPCISPHGAATLARSHSPQTRSENRRCAEANGRWRGVSVSGWGLGKDCQATREHPGGALTV